MRKILPLVALALLAAASPAAAGGPECGGFAPLDNECTATGTLPAVADVVIRVGAIYTGRVVVTVATSTGVFTGACSFVVGRDTGCTQSTTGLLLPGQSYTLHARTGVAAGRHEIRGLAVGRWEVFLDPA